MGDSCTVATSRRDVPSEFWERSRIGWHVTMYGVLAAATVPAVLDLDAVSLATSALLAISYATLGTRALSRGSLRAGVAYVPLGYLAFSVLALRDGSGYALLYVLYPQTFAIFQRERVALALVGVLSILLGVAVGAPDGDWGTAWVAALINFAVAALLGLWIGGVFRESEKRGHLIAELEAARSELAQSHRREGVLAERERLSHEIHDTLAQGFTSLVMLSRVATRALDAGDAGLARDRMTAAETVARENLAEARALVAALTPPPLAESALPEALERIVSRFGHESEIAASYEVRGDARALPAQQEVVLLRAAQEALSNVARHSGARAVQVRLGFEPQRTALVVADDGCGPGPDGHGGGFGLRGMRARLDEVGGILAVEAREGGGTTVRAEV